MTKYSLNESTLQFVLYIEDSFEEGTVITNEKLVELFRQSIYYKKVITSYYPTAISKSIWYAVKRSGKWEQKRGNYRKLSNNLSESYLDKTEVEYSAETLETIEVESKLIDSELDGEVDQFDREAFIKHLSENLYLTIMLKKQIADPGLKKYHLSSKGLGDDLYFLTESYFKQLNQYKGKYSMTDFITPNAKKALQEMDKSVRFVYEHMVPKNIYLNQIIEKTYLSELTEESIHILLDTYYYVCTVTKEENTLLPSTKMPINWDKTNPFARFEAAGIKFLPNDLRS